MTPIGASCAIRYHDSEDYFYAYISFGTWEDDAQRDSFSVLDSNIFLLPRLTGTQVIDRSRQRRRLHREGLRSRVSKLVRYLKHLTCPNRPLPSSVMTVGGYFFAPGRVIFFYPKRNAVVFSHRHLVVELVSPVPRRRRG